MKRLIYDPARQGKRMTIVCFVSGSGTNYERIVERDPAHDYVVFTNRPHCEGIAKARKNGHITITLSHAPYFKGARERYGGSIPRNCPEREKFERESWRLIEERSLRKPDLVCLAGYDLVFTDFSIDRYASRILNVHPGDTTKDYIGLHWIPTAQAILAGEAEIRSTLFIADKGLDTGPVLVQSRPLEIAPALATGGNALAEDLHKVVAFGKSRSIATYERFAEAADKELQEAMRRVCEYLQEALKVAGDWEIYPFAVHDLIGRGRVAIDDRTIFIDDNPMPVYGWRLD